MPDFPDSSLPRQPPAWEASFNAAMLSDFRDELAREAGTVTPGVDDTPYIQYAIEALTRDRDTGYSGDASTPSEIDVPTTRFFVPGQGSQYQNPQPQWQPTPSTLGPGGSAGIPMPVPVPVPYPTHPQPAVVSEGTGLLEPFRPDAAAVSADSLASTLLKGGHRPALPNEWASVDRDAAPANLPPLIFRPRVLRTGSLLFFATLSLLMVGALICSAVYSELHRGLLPYVSIYGGQYFLFRILPAILAAGILLYAQFIISTMFRILPFARLASDELEEREGAIFNDLYIKSFLWPQLVGPWQVWVPTFVVWLMNITIPLQSSLFTVIWVDDGWNWATVQGVAWTLVALYLALFVSAIIIWRYWATMEVTGLMWDPRSLADVAAIISDTNTAEEYRGTQIAGTREGIRFALRRQANLKLGYWTWRDGRPGFWYTLGTPSDNTSSAPVLDQLISKSGGGGGLKSSPQDKEKQGMLSSTTRGGLFSDDHHDMEISPQARYRYLPWCLRNNQLLYILVTSFVLLLALLVVCFLPSTRVTTNGFIPGLPAAPQRGAFSAANFLWSFFPSLLGMIIFLLFQSLDLNLRVLQPWASLSKDYPRGARAEQSLLADYAACAPLQSTFHALKNGHFRVAAISLLGTLFVFIPAVAGGMFMALTTPDDIVRMFPNIPALAIVLTLLVLYFIALVVLFPKRGHFRLPHGVTCLAEIISFLATEDLLNDLVFKQCRSREEMLSKMGVGRGTPESRPRWLFGGGHGAHQQEEDVLGVRRAKRFTEKRKVRKSQIRRGGAKGFLV
ncbi:protein piccolo [Rhypophila decipiens]|uniref:Protein piccolo n=1 Tax=Rhypophila decipiens TaxID=261697 RepID=A0AAN7BCU0_9PEZI|nr:protein piccolo [Rhypophila decipiens]